MVYWIEFTLWRSDGNWTIDTDSSSKLGVNRSIMSDDYSGKMDCTNGVTGRNQKTYLENMQWWDQLRLGNEYMYLNIESIN